MTRTKRITRSVCLPFTTSMESRCKQSYPADTRVNRETDSNRLKYKNFRKHFLDMKSFETRLKNIKTKYKITCNSS